MLTFRCFSTMTHASKKNVHVLDCLKLAMVTKNDQRQEERKENGDTNAICFYHSRAI